MIKLYKIECFSKLVRSKVSYTHEGRDSTPFVSNVIEGDEICLQLENLNDYEKRFLYREGRKGSFKVYIEIQAEGDVSHDVLNDLKSIISKYKITKQEAPGKVDSRALMPKFEDIEDDNNNS